MSDDIPTGKTQSCLIDAMIYDFQEITLHVTEPLDWSYANPRCWIQFQDGRPSSRMLTPQRVDDFTLTVPYNDDLHPEDWIMDDPDIDPPKLLFCVQNNNFGRSISGSSIIQSPGCRSSLYGTVSVKSSTRCGVSIRDDGRPS
ncbi:hypothetical protein [Klebsiella pneumoniae]|uniref:hypothetical protein n=2 Tax=Klebsiella pneumoniae TaxID=573 RepID=UPI001F614D6A|nr:hypothetical protein [Klebsiella pneumoniae]UNS80742.1 hypothetical protein MOQ79_27865 [Klebsiella pneumoniae]